jgi:hypothetical protein
MVIINGKRFYEEPACCGQCPFLFDYSTQMIPARGPFPCTLFNEWHKRMTDPPRRCRKMFKQALAYPDGSELGIYEKD